MSVSDDEMLTQLDRLGPEHVRAMLARGEIPDDWNVRAVVQWLAEKDYESDGSKSGGPEIPIDTGSMTEVVIRANRKSAWALALAIFSLIVSGAVLVLLAARQHGV